MTPNDFAFWLQGFIEMNPNAMVTRTQWEIVKDHLKLVMNKQTPNRTHTLLESIAPTFPMFPTATC